MSEKRTNAKKMECIQRQHNQQSISFEFFFSSFVDLSNVIRVAEGGGGNRDSGLKERSKKIFTHFEYRHSEPNANEFSISFVFVPVFEYQLQPDL